MPDGEGESVLVPDGDGESVLLADIDRVLMLAPDGEGESVLVPDGDGALVLPSLFTRLQNKVELLAALLLPFKLPVPVLRRLASLAVL